ncbi:hypothetical protein [Pseudanabaena mucicola]|uniref:DUF559 domain-containing protein n=1 Tax=Pseudanabaena mucicola FACHB-723 TaxID=2692860 RepID=A0ABR7ZUI4_9CYAN|nr:hypothetical protein [Pseudanabaena mucicola]MBD2186931.1 hypothetical protein [Pseudanabaena mucicola FACHB-723]
MRQFPAILIPPEVQRIAQSKPVALKFNTSLPRVPPPPPAPIQIKEAIFLSIGLIVVVAIVTAAVKELGIILLILGTVGIVLRIRFEFLTYKKRYQNHQHLLQNYFAKLEDYSREEVKYQQAFAIANSPDRILAFRHQQFQKLFAKMSPRNQSDTLPSIGDPVDQAQLAISKFGLTLQQYLAGMVYQGLTIHIPSIDYDWSPALTYVDPELNAHIAIEVVSASDQAATVRQNDLAEHFLLNSGWIMIKFAQDQIDQNPEACCKELAKLLDRLSLDPSVLPQFANISDLRVVKI